MEGGEQVSQKNHDVLAQLVGEENVDTYYVHDEEKGKKVTDYLRGIWYFFQNYYFGLTPYRVSEITEMAKRYDTVFIDRSVFGIVSKELKGNSYKGKVISFFHNVEKQYFSAKIPKYAPWRPLVCHCVDKNDGYCCKYSDKIVTLNERDQNLIMRLYGRKSDVLIPIAFKDKCENDSPTTNMTHPKLRCLFIGSYFKANVDGIEWFIKNVFPFVDIELTIVGKGMIKLKDFGNLQQGIKVIDNAPDLRPYMLDADVMVLPIFSGGGMKVKTCEALMYGKNILASDESLEGYDLDAEKIGGRCNTADEYIAKIKEFELKPRPVYNIYSRKVFLEKYSEQQVVEKFRGLLI